MKGNQGETRVLTASQVETLSRWREEEERRIENRILVTMVLQGFCPPPQEFKDEFRFRVMAEMELGVQIDRAVGSVIFDLTERGDSPPQ